MRELWDGQRERRETTTCELFANSKPEFVSYLMIHCEVVFPIRTRFRRKRCIFQPLFRLRNQRFEHRNARSEFAVHLATAGIYAREDALLLAIGKTTLNQFFPKGCADLMGLLVAMCGHQNTCCDPPLNLDDVLFIVAHSGDEICFDTAIFTNGFLERNFE